MDEWILAVAVGLVCIAAMLYTKCAQRRCAKVGHVWKHTPIGVVCRRCREELEADD